MKKIDTNKSSGELLTMASELREKLNQLRFNMAEKKLQDTSQAKKLRRNLARVLTALKKIT